MEEILTKNKQNRLEYIKGWYMIYRISIYYPLLKIWSDNLLSIRTKSLTNGNKGISKPILKSVIPVGYPLKVRVLTKPRFTNESTGYHEDDQ